MAREIALREEYFQQQDDKTLQKVVQLLSREFLLIELDDYRIEVSELDYPAMSRALGELQRKLKAKAP